MATYACDINGVAALIDDRLSITTPQNGIASLSGQFTAETTSGLPTFDDVVEIFEDAEVIFAGKITQPSIGGIRGRGTDAVALTITAHSHEALETRRVIVALEVPAGTLKDALEAIVPYIPDVTLDAGQVDGPSIEAFSISAWRPSQALDYLTQVTGYVRKIEPTLTLRMIEPGTENAPFDIAEGDGNVDGDLTVTYKRNDYANRIIVIGTGVTSTAEDLADISDNGPWEILVNAPDANTQAGVDALSAAMLATKMIEIEEISYPTLRTGLAPGQTQVVVLPTRDLNGPFLLTEVNLNLYGGLARRTVRGVSGSVYPMADWRAHTKNLFSGGGAGSINLPGVTGGGGIASRRYAYPLGAEQTTQLRAKTAGEWVRVSPMPVWLDAAARATTTARVSLVLKNWFNEDMVLQARLWDDEDGQSRGVSTTVQAMDWTPRIFTATGINGTHPHYLEVLPSISDADEPEHPPDFGVMGYVE